jgi:two-component system, OmpR family, response regulator
MTDSILVVDDEAEFRTTLVRYLTIEGFSVTGVADGEAMRQVLAETDVDLVILDLGLGQETGFDLLRKLRETRDIAVIILTGKSDPVDRIVGLELGADDYVTKPFLNRELLARIKAVIRRARAHPATTTAAQQAAAKALRFRGWEIDTVARRLTSPAGEAVPLTAAEFEILAELAAKSSTPVSRSRLLEVAHRRAWTPDDRSVDIHIHNLRRKLADGDSGPDMIVASRNVGYLLAAEVTRA